MLLANMSVSHKIYEEFPQSAILRRHPRPQRRCIESFEKSCRSLGLDVDVTSAGALQVRLLISLTIFHCCSCITGGSLHHLTVLDFASIMMRSVP